MKRPKSITAALADLSEAGTTVDRQEAVDTLRTALGAKSHAIVAQAAELAARLELGELARDLRDAFGRFCGDGMNSDKQCQAKTAVVRALHRLKSDETDVFVEGMGLYWPARPRDGGRDVAASLRTAAAHAYAELGPPAEVDPLVDLLADPVADVRLIAVRALAALGGPHNGSLLRLKVLLGDGDPNVIEECFAVLLDGEKDRYLPFVARYMEDENPRLCVAAALSLGRSRHAKALDLLTSRWRSVGDPEFKRDLLVAVALLRSEPAVTFLLSLLSESTDEAEDAIAALSHLQMLPHVRERVETAVSRSDDGQLRHAFRTYFRQVGSPST